MVRPRRLRSACPRYLKVALEYLSQVWRSLHPYGHIKLFVADRRGEAVAASVLIVFGDTVTDWRGGWSGRFARDHANEMLEWTTIQWAKSQGYRYFDFGGISTESVAAMLDGSRPDTTGVTFFKLGFGGQVVYFPQAYEYFANDVVRWAYKALGRCIAEKVDLQRLLNFFRTATHA